MYRLFSLSILLIIIIHANAEPKTPKIYNVLISTKKNLSPSHALPVYEPVLRTTSLGFAFPPFYYHPFVYPENYIKPNILKINPQNAEQDNTQPLPLESYVPYGYNQQSPYLGDETKEISQQSAKNDKTNEDPKNVIANLRRNPNIPDVQPPALPVKH